MTDQLTYFGPSVEQLSDSDVISVLRNLRRLQALEVEGQQQEPVTPETIVLVEFDDHFVQVASNFDLEEGNDLRLCCDAVAEYMPGGKCRHIFPNAESATAHSLGLAE
ncbi:MAG: hypothetical protein JST84_05145 [Acidobacteria bacterium]|nr:hypothetical protein [Acidobacteriota bacterium]